MSVKTIISDGSGTGKKMDLFEREDSVGAIVYTEELRVFNSRFAAFANGSLGIDMNVDASFGGTPISIHDGVDNVYWTGTSIVGTKFTFDSTDRANSGAQSVKINVPSVNDVMQFVTGSSVDLNNYAAVTMYINVDQNWTPGSLDSAELYGWDTVLNAQVGTAVRLEDYFSETTTDTWHKLSIPLSDMSLEISSIDAFRIEMVAKSGQAPIWYLDDFQLEETSGIATYTVAPEVGTIYHLTELDFVFADVYDSAVVNGTMLGIPHDSWLGVPAVDAGLSIKSTLNDVIKFQATFKQLSDLASLGDIKNAMSDGTNTYFKVTIDLLQTIFVSLDARTSDTLSIVLSDDWSGLTLMRVFTRGKVENVK